MTATMEASTATSRENGEFESSTNIMKDDDDLLQQPATASESDEPASPSQRPSRKTRGGRTSTSTSTSTSSGTNSGKTTRKKTTRSESDRRRKAKARDNTSNNSSNININSHSHSNASSRSSSASRPPINATTTAGESLTKDHSRRSANHPSVPPQLGHINPIGCQHEEDEDSCGPTGTTSTSTSGQQQQQQQEEDSMTFSGWQQHESHRSSSTHTTSAMSLTSGHFLSSTLLVLPSSSMQSSAHPASSPPVLVVADPEALLSHLLQSVQTGHDQDEQDVAHQLRQAMSHLVESAEHVHVPVTGSGTAAATATATLGNTPTLGNTAQQQQEQLDLLQDMQAQLQMQQKKLHDQHQQFLAFQQQALLDRQMQQEQMNQLQTLVSQLQQDLVLAATVQSSQSPPTTSFQSPPHHSSPPSTPTPPPTHDEETERMLNRLQAFENMSMNMTMEMEMEMEQEQPTTNSIITATKTDTGPTTMQDDPDDDDDDDDDDDSIGDDDDNDDNDATIARSSQPQPQTATDCNGIIPEDASVVIVWTCSSCHFEHHHEQAAGMHFCGVCGTEKRMVTPCHTNTSDMGSGNQEIYERTTAANDDGDEWDLSSTRPSSPQPLPSPPPPQEPLIQLQRHDQLQASERGNNIKDVAPKSPHRRNKYARSKSTTDVRVAGGRSPGTPRRGVRQRVPPRSRTEMPQSSTDNTMNHTFHGQPSSFPVLVKSLDGDEQSFDMDMLNNQLSTFDNAPVASAGSVPTRSAPKTPKINKKKVSPYRRSKSELDDPSNPTPIASVSPPFSAAAAASATTTTAAKPTIRQAIPRRAKSSSTDQLRLHQQLQQGGGALAVPPSPSVAKRGLLGAAVSALHKSPKKAISALKIARDAVPKSLLMGGGGGSSGNKGKSKGFLLDDGSDASEDDDDPRTSALESPYTPKRRGSLEARASASLVSSSAATNTNKQSGWKKWFDTTSTKNSAHETALESAPYHLGDVDIDDTFHDEPEDNYDDVDDTDASEDDAEPEKARRRQRGKADGRAQSRGRRRPNEDGLRRNSAHGERNRSSRNSVERKNELRASSSHRAGSNGRPRRRSQEPRARDELATSGHNGKPRDWGRRRRMSLDRQRSGLGNDEALSKTISQIPLDPTFKVRKDVQDQWVRQDQIEEAKVKADQLKQKADQLKQRFQGLQTATAAPASPSMAKSNCDQVTTPEEISESTEGCSIYLEKSIGDMSEVTSYV